MLETPEVSHSRPTVPIGYKQRAAIYHLECDGSDDHQFLSQLIAPHVRSVLEIPAGVGRNLNVWKEHPNIKIVVADIENEMVKRLRIKIIADSALSHVEAVEADMTNLNLGKQFDIIIVPQEAFQIAASLESAPHVLGRLREHLSDSGRLVIDTCRLSPSSKGPFPAYYDPDIPDGIKINEWSKVLDTGQTLTRSRTQHHVSTGVEIYLEYMLDLGVDIRQWSTRMLLSNFSDAELRRCAYESGLTVVDTFSDYDLESHDGISARAIYCLKRTSFDPATLYD